MIERRSAFVEVSSPGWAFWRSLLDTCVGLVVGALYVFLGILVAGIVGEEALSSVYRQIDLDPLFRASMGAILLVAAVLAIAVPLVLVAERFAALRAAEASAVAEPDRVPQHSLRMELQSSPAAHLRLTGAVLFWTVAGLGGIFLLGVVFTEDLREDAVSWVVLAGFAIVGLLAFLLRRLGARLVETNSQRLADVQARWARLLPRAVSADRERREGSAAAVAPRWLTVPSARALGRIATVLTAATLVSLGAFMLSVFMRQQCRSCDPIYWNEPIENGIDVLSLSSGAAIAVCATLALVAWVGGVGLQAARETALARWAADGGARKVEIALIEPLISGNRALVRLQLGLSAVGAGSTVIGTGALWAGSAVIDPQTAFVVAVVAVGAGLILGWLDAPRARRERQIVRDATTPGDVQRLGAASDSSGASTSARRGRR